MSNAIHSRTNERGRRSEARFQAHAVALAPMQYEIALAIQAAQGVGDVRLDTAQRPRVVKKHLHALLGKLV